jgi:creatinine amidohydrolase
MYDAVEARHGIHAGDIETSLMLSFRRDLVRMDKTKDFVSSAIGMEKEFKQLSPAGTHGFGWIAQDLNSDGAVGNAALASADKGARTAAHQIDGFLELLRDMTNFHLSRLFARPDKASA